MLETILIIVLSVAVFGVLFFLYVKNVLKKQLNYYLSKNNKKKKLKKNIKLNHFTKFFEFFFRNI